MNSDNLQDVKVNVKIVLAALWAAHFLLWTFGDMASLLQEMAEPVDDELLLFIAVPLAMTQALMILFSLVGKPKMVRWANMIVVLVFAVFNLGFMAESTVAWEFLLGLAYLLFNGFIFYYAWTWPKQDGVEGTP